jgi:hypothetical protein
MKGRCKHCQEVVHSNPFISHDFQMCSCKKSGIDDAGYMCRLIGDISVAEFKKENDIETKKYRINNI